MLLSLPSLAKSHPWRDVIPRHLQLSRLLGEASPVWRQSSEEELQVQAEESEGTLTFREEYIKVIKGTWGALGATRTVSERRPNGSGMEVLGYTPHTRECGPKYYSTYNCNTEITIILYGRGPKEIVNNSEKKMGRFLTDCVIPLLSDIRFIGVSWKLTESGVKASSCGVVAWQAWGQSQKWNPTEKVVVRTKS